MLFYVLHVVTETQHVGSSARKSVQCVLHRYRQRISWWLLNYAGYIVFWFLLSNNPVYIHVRSCPRCLGKAILRGTPHQAFIASAVTHPQRVILSCYVWPRGLGVAKVAIGRTWGVRHKHLRFVRLY